MNISPIRRFSQLAFCVLLLCMLSASRATAQTTPACFQFFFPTLHAEPGDTVCLPLMARDFKNIASFQFAVFWNPDDLEFISKDFSNSDVPGVLSNQFSPPPITNQLVMAWSSSTGLPITRPDSALIYNICFRVKNGASGFLPLRIGGTQNAIFEVAQSNPETVFLPLVQQIGGVSTLPVAATDLTVSSTCVANANCNNPIGSIATQISGGVPPYNYSWSGPNGFSANTADITGLAGGLYMVTVSDQEGSTVMLQVEVKSGYFGLTATTQTTPAFCGQATGCASLEASGSNPPFTFEWSTGNNQSPASCNLPPGQYSVTVTDAVGCNSIYPIEIQNDTTFGASSGLAFIEACNQTETFTISTFSYPGPFTYLWSTGETTATVEGLEAGMYTFTVTSVPGGCTAVGDLEIYDISASSWQLNLAPICEDLGNTPTGSLVLEYAPAGTLSFPIIVAWSDGTTRQLNAPVANGILDSLVNIPSGHYAATITDANGCQTVAERTLNCTLPPPTPNDYPWFYVEGTPSNPDSCTGVYAKHFEGISELRFTLEWPFYGANLKEIKNLQLPGLTLNDLSVLPQGKIVLDWESVSPVSLPDESLLFEVCFTPLYEHPSEAIGFTQFPTEPLVLTETGPVAFIGKTGLAYYNETINVPEIVCQAAVQVPDCSADGRAQILMEACTPNTLLDGYFNHLNTLDELTYYADLSGLLFAEAGAYRISVTQNNQDWEEFFAFIPDIPAQSECVWPGDADNNNAVNHHDLLYIGLAYDAQGLIRPNASLDWIGQESPDWAQATAVRNVNYKNIDTNGDGTINAADTMAIVQNWGRVVNPAKDNPFDAPLDSLGNHPIPDLTLATDTLTPGQALDFPLLLGTQNNQMDNLYGIAFSISYDAAVVKDNIRFTPSASWFGEESQFLWIQKNFADQGRLDVAITRKDGMPVSGWGPIGSVLIIIEDNIFGTQDLGHDTSTTSRLFFSEISSTSNGEIPQIIDAPPVELVIQKQTVSTQTPFLSEKSILLSPNPASKHLLLQSYSSPITRVEISSADGSQQKTSSFGSPMQQVQIGLEQLPAGTYFARVFCGDGVAVKKFVIGG